MAEFLPEIIVHLDSDRVDLRTEAATALIHLVDRDETTEIEADGIEKIFRCFLDANNDLSSVSAALMTNLLAGKSDVVGSIDVVTAFHHSAELVKKDSMHTNTFLMFLSNLTIEETVCSTIMDSEGSIELLRYFLDLFVNYNPQAVEFDGITNFDEFDVYQHAGSFLCNMSRLEKFRSVICNMEQPFLPQFFDQVR